MLTLSTPPGRRFAAHHPWDRNALALMLALIWLAILLGFGRNIARRGFNFPLVVYFHVAAVVGWMILFTVQTLLIRMQQQALHRKLGLFGLALAIAIVVLGVWSGIAVQSIGPGGPHNNPPYLSVNFTSMVVFAGLVGAALVLRCDGAAHKRLMLLALINLSHEAFVRLLGARIYLFFGYNPFGFWALVYLVSTLLVLSIGAYDLFTRRRLLPTYVWGSLFSVVLQVASIAIYFSPGWHALALQMVGR